MTPETDLTPLPLDDAGFAEIASHFSAARQQLYEAYRDDQIVASLVRQLPWTHMSRSLSPALLAEYQTILPGKKLLQAKLNEFYLQNASEGDEA